MTYTLSNTGHTTISYAISKSKNWLSLSGTGGSLTPGASNNVTVSINSNANSLSAGSYPDTVFFTNTTNGNGNTSRSVSLTVNPPANPCEGDFDGDGDVDGTDLAVFAADFGRTDCGAPTPCPGDFDNDGDVDGTDLAIFAANFGRTDCP